MNEAFGPEVRYVTTNGLSQIAGAQFRIPYVHVLAEPVSGSPGCPLKTAAGAHAVISRVREQAGMGNVGFLCDLYHLAANGDDVAAVAARGDQVAHVQIADAPGRGEPGTGELDLAALLAALSASGYDGWVALEYKPSGPTAKSFANLPPLG